jgi:membrane protease YdiL (CAAX protease family)
LIVGCITLAVTPEKSHWHSVIRAWGLMGLLLTGIVEAALPEEFVRMLLQTRLGSTLKNKGLGFVLATFLWASMHIPIGFRDSKAGPWHVIAGAWVIMPMGFLWGYITHRTKSLFPSILMHGLNLWGLQNFF